MEPIRTQHPEKAYLFAFFPQAIRAKAESYGYQDHAQAEQASGTVAADNWHQRRHQEIYDFPYSDTLPSTSSHASLSLRQPSSSPYSPHISSQHNQYYVDNQHSAQELPTGQDFHQPHPVSAVLSQSVDSGNLPLSSRPNSPTNLANHLFTMDMLGNLMQMQHSLDTHMTSPTSGASSTPAENGNANSGNSSGGSSAMLGAMNGSSYNPQLLLEQQFKLTQLQQLQQLQNQIFQQQMALIRGGNAGLLPDLANALSMPSTSSPIDNSTQRERPMSFHGLPTPAASTELRPQLQSLDFVSPMILGETMGTPGQPPPLTPTSAMQMTSAYRNPESQLSLPLPQLPSSVPFHGQHLHPPRGSTSASEHVVFRTHSTSAEDFDISPLTSPWLGAHPNNQHHPFQQHAQSINHSTLQLQSQQPPAISNLAPSLTGNGSGNHKRGAPGDIDEGARKRQSPAIRPTAPPIIAISQAATNKKPSHRGSKSTNSTPLMRGSSTRSRKGSSADSGAGTNTGSNPGTVHNSAVLGSSSVFNVEVIGDTPSPVDLSMPPPAPPSSASSPTSPAAIGDNENGINSKLGAIGGSLTSSPQHLTPVTPASMMGLNVPGSNTNSLAPRPSPLTLSPASAAHQSNTPQLQVQIPDQSSRSHRRQQSATDTSSQSHTPLVTPALQPKQSGDGGATRQKNATDSPTTSETKKAGTGLKVLRPAGPVTPATPFASASSQGAINNSPASAATSNMSAANNVPPTGRKTSHKDAEQKRRDSLKTSFDDLRGLLPPIPLIIHGGNDDDTGGGTSSATASGSALPVLPGALPPRGPPKAGGEGPNKAVSKLQLLMCGNDYIRVLKGRVERRDDEVAKLRNEIRALRGAISRLKVGIGGAGECMNGDQDQMDVIEDGVEECDLEQDLDVCEANNPPLGRMSVVGYAALISNNGNNASNRHGSGGVGGVRGTGGSGDGGAAGGRGPGSLLLVGEEDEEGLGDGDA